MHGLYKRDDIEGYVYKFLTDEQQKGVFAMCPCSSQRINPQLPPHHFVTPAVRK